MASNRRKSAEPLPEPPAWLDAAYGQVPLPICVTHQKRLVWVNPEFENFYACQREAIRGKGMKDVVVTRGQLKTQLTKIDRLKTSLNSGGLGIQHFLNKSGKREVGVLVVAFEVEERGCKFSVGIAIPDRINNLFRFLIRNVVIDAFDEGQFLGCLTEREKSILRDYSKPRAAAKSVGGSQTKNGARDIVHTVGKKLSTHLWLKPGIEFSLPDLKLLAMALGPLLQTDQKNQGKVSRKKTVPKTKRRPVT
jgi:hypothetical protein